MIILDTNVLSELMKPTPSARVVAWAKKQSASDGLIGTPTNDGLNPSLLFRRKINRHGVLVPLFVVFSVP